MSKTKIEWADQVWNPISGCSPISEGCANCYAARMARRLAGRYGYPKDEPFLPGWPHPNKYNEPFKWKGQQKVFVCSMGDLFHEDVPIKAFADVMDVILNNPQHTFMMLTKRPMNMYLRLGKKALSHQMAINYEYHIPLPNLWLGVSVENQRTADERIPMLLQIPAAKHFVSVEPMLESVDISNWLWGYHYGELSWVICGPETGPGARPCKREWIVDLCLQTRDAGLPFFDKKDVLGEGIQEWPK